MKYTLTKPCATCPFRKDGAGVKLYPARIREIAKSTGWNGASFACHSSLDYSKTDNDEFDDGGQLSREMSSDPKTQHCGGAIIFGLKNGGPHQMLRIAARLGMADLDGAMQNAAMVYDSVTEWLKKGAFPTRRRKGLT